MLGLKGTMSEAELHLIKSRLTAGLKHKAAKGELRQGLPVGLDYDQDDRVVLTADALADVLAGIQLLGAGAQISWAVARGARVGGLHDAPAPAAAQQTLQQRAALAHRAAGKFAGPAPVAAQTGGVGLVGLPADISGMVIADEHLPLLTRHQLNP